MNQIEFALIIIILGISLFPIIALMAKLSKRYIYSLIILQIPIFLGILEYFNIITLFNREIWHIICFFAIFSYATIVIFCLYEYYQNKWILLLFLVLPFIVLFFVLDWELSWGIIFDNSNRHKHIRWDVGGIVSGLIFCYWVFDP